MINNYRKYKQYINIEYKNYYFTKKERLESILVKDSIYYIWKYQKLLRKTELYHNKYKKSKCIIKLFFLFLWTFYRKKKNKYGIKLGIEITDGTFDSGLLIWHHSSIVVNGNSKVGKNCRIHGACCIGNNGKDLECPVIGDNVDIGVGAYIIGGITIADDVKVGAGAVVVNSIDKKGAVVISRKSNFK